MTLRSSTGPALCPRCPREMTAARARIEVAALQTLLTVLGALMLLASRRVDRFRRQVTRDLLLEIRSADGAASSTDSRRPRGGCRCRATPASAPSAR